MYENIENLALFLSVIVATLLGLITVVFIFWAQAGARIPEWVKDNLKKNPFIVGFFGILSAIGVILIMISFFIMYKASVSQAEDWKFFYFQLLIIGFPIFITLMVIFFYTLIYKLSKK